MKRTIRLSESNFNRLIKESVEQYLTELDWRTYASAAKKAEKWRRENPNHRVNQWNRVMDFDNAAMGAFNDQHGYEPYDEEQYGGEVGRINPHFYNGEASISASRDHNFGDENTRSLPHTVYHMSKEYGKDGGYGRTRMWDYAHETTPEEFFDDEELGNKYREMERNIEDYQNDNFEYVPKQGWQRKTSNESRLRDIVKESIKNYLKESWYDKWDERENKLKTIKQIEEQCKVEAIYLPDGTIIFDFQDEYYNHEDFDEWCEIEFFPDIDAEVNAPAYTIVELDYDLNGSPKPTEEQMKQIIEQYQEQIMQNMAETAEKYYGYDLVY